MTTFGSARQAVRRIKRSRARVELTADFAEPIAVARQIIKV